MQPQLTTLELGINSGRGNLLGVQPAVHPSSYRSARTLFNVLDGYLAAAQSRGWLTERTIVVLPEYIGTWLVAQGAWPLVYSSPQTTRAMLALIAQHPLRFLNALRRAKSSDKLRESIFRMRAPDMARAYQQVCGTLARRYGVTLVGGSIALPSPWAGNDRLHTGDGRLTNVCAVFQPDGKPYDRLVRKIYPIDEERGFTTAATPTELPAFATPAGCLGVLICADSWYPAPYAALQAQGAELLAVPSYLAPTGAWQQRWRGYNGAAPPNDVDNRHIGTLREGEAWLRYAMAGRAAAHGIRAGVNVFLRGEVWDLGTAGASIGLRADETAIVPDAAEAALLVVWL